jgi:hypothetical protein
MAPISATEHIVRRIAPTAPTSTSPAHSASSRSRRRSCGVAQGKPAGRPGRGRMRGAAGGVISVEFFLTGGGSRRAAVLGCARSHLNCRVVGERLKSTLLGHSASPSAPAYRSRRGSIRPQSPTFADGYYVKLENLKPRPQPYDIHFHAEAESDVLGKAVQDVTYHLTVVSVLSKYSWGSTGEGFRKLRGQTDDAARRHLAGAVAPSGGAVGREVGQTRSGTDGILRQLQ